MLDLLVSKFERVLMSSSAATPSANQTELELSAKSTSLPFSVGYLTSSTSSTPMPPILRVLQIPP